MSITGEFTAQLSSKFREKHKKLSFPYMSFNTDLDKHIFKRMLHSEDRLVPIVTPEKKRVTN